MVDNRSIPLLSGIIAGIFIIVGIGLGLTGYLGISFAADTLMENSEDTFGAAFVAIIFLQCVLMTFFVGPSIAAVTAVAVSIVTDDIKTAVASSGIGALVGFFVMTILAILIMSTAFPETGGGAGGDASQPIGADNIVLLIQGAIPTTFVGLAVPVVAARGLVPEVRETVRA